MYNKTSQTLTHICNNLKLTILSCNFFALDKILSLYLFYIYGQGHLKVKVILRSRSSLCQGHLKVKIRVLYNFQISFCEYKQSQESCDQH